LLAFFSKGHTYSAKLIKSGAAGSTCLNFSFLFFILLEIAAPCKMPL